LRELFRCAFYIPVVAAPLRGARPGKDRALGGAGGKEGKKRE